MTGPLCRPTGLINIAPETHWPIRGGGNSWDPFLDKAVITAIANTVLSFPPTLVWWLFSQVSSSIQTSGLWCEGQKGVRVMTPGFFPPDQLMVIRRPCRVGLSGTQISKDEC